MSGVAVMHQVRGGNGFCPCEESAPRHVPASNPSSDLAVERDIAVWLHAELCDTLRRAARTRHIWATAHAEAVAYLARAAARV